MKADWDDCALEVQEALICYDDIRSIEDIKQMGEMFGQNG